MKFTAIIEKSDDGYYVGQVQEVPAAISQGKTIKELTENLQDALKLVLEYESEKTKNNYKGRKFISRKLTLTT